jgi:hypothetical protein
MWPFMKITDWPNKDWDVWSMFSENERKRLVALRATATLATKHDLQKPVQHLLRDVHESLAYPWPHPSKEAADKADDGIRGPYEDMPIQFHRLIVELGRLQGAQKATAALLAITAYEASRAARWLILLTIGILIPTVALVAFEAAHFWEKPARENRNEQSGRYDVGHETKKGSQEHEKPPVRPAPAVPADTQKP